MITDPVKLKAAAEARVNENYQFRQFIKHHPRLSSEQVDGIVHKLEQKVWQKIDCTTCANCCREVAPTFSQSDIDRLAGHLGVSNSELIEKYLKPTESTEENPWIMRQTPCPFLADSRCTVYEHRPENCRDYPYLHKDEFTSRTLSMIGRIPQCPAVFEVWEDLKRATGFRRNAG
jgi:Fe-S-cluster containining protein